MRKIKKILLPVDFPDPALRVIHQAASLARQFHSQIVMLHVVSALSHAAGVPDDGRELAAWDMLAEIISSARRKSDPALGPALDGIAIQCLVAKGSVARSIVYTAQRGKADLIMMPSYGHTFDEFLLGSVAVADGPECPIWTDPSGEGKPLAELAIRNVLCAVDFNPHDYEAASWAAQMADEFGARLTLAHATAGVELWGPGGAYVNPRWKRELVGDASQQIARFQQDMGIKTAVFIGSGGRPGVLSQAVSQTKADLLVVGSYPYGNDLRTRGYAIMRAVPIPVLSV